MLAAAVPSPFSGRLADLGRITILESLRCVKLVLWDERAKRLVSSRDAS